MGLKSLIKRTTKGSPLTHTEVDDNWQAIEDTFQTPTDSDIGKVPVLKSDKTGFEFVSLPGGGGGQIAFTKTKAEIEKMSGNEVKEAVLSYFKSILE